jgi:DNA primase
MKVAQFLVTEIVQDNLAFENELFHSILSSVEKIMEEQEQIDLQRFLNSHDPRISSITVELLSTPYFLSDNWEQMHKIFVPREEEMLRDVVEKSIFHLKNRKVLRMMEENQKKIREAYANGEDFTSLMEMHQRLEQVKMEISKVLGIDILR